MVKKDGQDQLEIEVLHRIGEDSNIQHNNEKKQTNCICQSLRGDDLLKHVIEGKIEGRLEVTGRRVRRRKQLLDD
jgi:hypothetical protein